MTTPSTTTIPNKYCIPFLLALIAAGLVGNYFRYPIFLNIDFLFGGIFALLALQFFGLGRGILAAAIIAGYTYFAWNHPYAIIIMTAEVAVVGWLMTRRKMGMVLADALFWLIIGMPLVYIFYHLLMHATPSNTSIVITKQAVNGITNALVARLLFAGYALRSRSELISYREIVYNQLAFFVLVPALIILAVGSRNDYKETDLHIRTLLIQESGRVKQRLETWVLDRKTVIIHLAELSATHSPQEMQPRLEQTRQSDLNFEIVTLLNKEAITTAFSPLIDELGQSTIGKSYAVRPYIPKLKETLKPMLTEVALSRFGNPRPLVRMIAPVVVYGKYSGYVSGVLKLEQIQEYLNTSVGKLSTLYTLLDKNDNIITTNHPDQTVMRPLEHGKGTVSRLDRNINQWMPILPRNTPVSERWTKSNYITEVTIGDQAEWKLILEQPVAPFQKLLYDNYTNKLSLLFFILLASLGFAELSTRWTILTLKKLSNITRDLPDRLMTNGREIVWPESGINETNHLIDNFRKMAEALTAVFAEKRHINEVLEQRVHERTRQLWESEERFNNMFRKHSAMMFLIEPKSGAIIDANLSAEKFYGYSRKILLSKNITDLNTLSPELIALERQNALNQNRNYFMFPHRKANGKVHIVEVHSTPIKLHNNTILFSIIHDITERQQFEAALRESEERFRNMANATPVLIWISGADKLCYWFNRVWLNFTGRSMEQETGNGWAEGVHPDDLDRCLETYVTAFDNRQPFTMEYRMRASDGKYCWLLVNGVPTYTDKTFSGYIGSCVDITQRKQTEDALTTNTRLLQTVINTIPMRIFWKDKDFRLLGCNQVFAKDVDAHPDDLIGKDDYQIVGKEFAELYRIADRRIIESKVPILSYEEPLTTAKGDRIWLRTSKVPLFNEVNEFFGILGVYDDITFQKQAEEELREAKAAAESATLAKSRFLSVVAHEFHTPLGLIVVGSDILEEYWDSLTRKQQMIQLKQIRNAANQLSTLVDSVNIFNRHEIGFSNENRQLLDIGQLCRTIASDVNAVSGNGQDFTISVFTESVTVMINVILLRQVLENLLTNAFRFTPVEGTVTLTVSHQSDQLLIEVVDTGIGIPEDEQESIYSAFYRSSNVNARKGLGLGLSIVVAALQEMKGTITMTSRVGEGSTFRVVLPAVAQTPTTEEEQ